MLCWLYCLCFVFWFCCWHFMRAGPAECLLLVHKICWWAPSTRMWNDNYVAYYCSERTLPSRSFALHKRQHFAANSENRLIYMINGVSRAFVMDYNLQSFAQFRMCHVCDLKCEREYEIYILVDYISFQICFNKRPNTDHTASDIHNPHIV